MRYLCLIYFPESARPGLSAPERQALAGESARAPGPAWLARLRLEESASATCLRVREGRLSLADGPCVGLDAQLTELYLLEAADDAQALVWAAELPQASVASIEVRPLRPIADRPTLGHGA